MFTELIKAILGIFILQNYDPQDFKDEPKEKLCLDPFCYPSYGNYHSLDVLNSSELKTSIYTKSIEEQMNYADAVVRRYALNPHFIEMQKPNEQDIESFFKKMKSKINVTTIGNCAFMASNNPNDVFFTGIYHKLMSKKPPLP